jgi:hypothetical protein
VFSGAQAPSSLFRSSSTKNKKFWSACRFAFHAATGWTARRFNPAFA